MKYNEIVKVNESFQYSINLQFDINNIDKIKEYIPTKDSCEIMGYYLDSILGNFSKATTLIGPYGKGKSHLLLVLMTLLNNYNPSDKKVIDNLISKTQNIDENFYNTIKKIRQEKKKFMPVIINSNYNNLNQSFLLGLTEALEREDIKDINFTTYFDTALEVLEKWEEKEHKDALVKFTECLKKSNVTLGELKKSLKMYDDKAYSTFKDVYQCVMHGVEFNPLINTDVIKYYKDVNYKICQNGYTGILIIFDEFSKFLEYAANDSLMKDLKLLQDFAELATRTGKSEQIILSCITHKTINEYIKNLKDNKVNAFKTVEGRFKEIYFNRSIEQNYELISQTIKKREPFEDHYKKYYKSNKEFYDDMMNNFSFSKIDNIDNILFKGCYPLNPLTVYSVITLSEKIAQNERTLFTFLTDDDTTSFKAFIKNESKGLFDVDKIYDYFNLIFKKETDYIKEIWIKAESTLSKVESEVEKRIIKALAIIYMINDLNVIVPNEKTIRLALNENIDDTLQKMINNGSIRLKKTTQTIDFSTIYSHELMKEIERIAETKYYNIDEHDAINKICNNEYILPRKFNQEYKMTRFFKVLYLGEEQIKNIKSFNLIHNENFSDGIIINLLRKNKTLKSTVANLEHISDSKVIVRIPKATFNEEISNIIKEYEAIQYIKKNETLDGEAIKELNMIEQELVEYIKEYANSNYAPENIEGYFYLGNMNKNINNVSSFVSNICEELYSKTVIINNEMINKNNISAPIEKARNIVIDSILNHNKTAIKSDTSAEATIYKATVDKINITSISTAVKLIKNYIKKADKSKKDLNTIYQTLYKEPYGVRKGVMPILTALAIDDFSEYSVLYYQNKEIDLNADSISKIVDSPDKYYIKLQEGTEEKFSYVIDLMKIFGLKDSKSNRINVQLLVKEMRRWMLGMPRVIKELDNGNIALTNNTAVVLKNELLKSDVNNNEFIFETLFNIFSTNDTKTVVKSISNIKDLFDNFIEAYSIKIIEEVKEIFEHKSKSSLAIILKKWYEKINEKLKLSIVKLDIKQFLDCIEKIDNYDDFEILQNLSFTVCGVYIEDWQDKTNEEFITKIKDIINDINELSKKKSENKDVLIISDGKEEIKKYLESDEISFLGNTLMNNIEDSIDEYGDSISESEKIKVLLKIMKKYI